MTFRQAIESDTALSSNFGHYLFAPIRNAFEKFREDIISGLLEDTLNFNGAPEMVSKYCDITIVDLLVFIPSLKFCVKSKFVAMILFGISCRIPRGNSFPRVRSVDLDIRIYLTVVNNRE